MSSKLWELQQSYYTSATIREWAFRNLPLSFSSSSYLAKVSFSFVFAL